ncbi:uncharacterized protein [Rutidosis leptorrhynchoides]|uniref:uncharacterized protein n=1 Tax=Rutidosis leptorrhynchoides TaxID=125765 RepID=UPI003A9972DE
MATFPIESQFGGENFGLFTLSMQQLFDNALLPMLTNITLHALENLKSFELYPSQIPYLLSGRPLIVSGRYQGTFPDAVKIRGLLADRSSYVIDVKVRKKGDVN